MFGHRPRLPVDLLFPTVRRDENSRTTDEYVMSLYDKLKSALASVRDATILEAQRQKRLYNCKAREVELHPGDKVLLKLYAFTGQWQKLKNWWGDALYTVVKCVADMIPAHEVENDANKKRQVLHQARLLLWLTELVVSRSGWTAYWLNLVSLERNWWCHSVGVLNWAWYHASWSMDSRRPCLSPGESCQVWRWAMKPEGHLRGRPRMEQAIGSPVTSSLIRGLCGPCWETSLKDEHNRPDDVLKHDPSWGAGNGMGWPLTETPGTQVSRSPLTSLLWEQHRWRLPKWATLLFFLPNHKPCLARGHAIFSHQGGEIEMQLLWREVLGSWKCLEWRATCE